MKKLVLGLLSLFLVVGTIQAQEGKKALKKGAKMLQKYSQNAIDNSDQLIEGLSLVEKAFESDEVKGQMKYKNMLASAYNAVAEGQINAKVLNPDFKVINGEVAIKALDAVKDVLMNGEKKGDKKDAVEILVENENHLNNLGIYAFQAQNYADAFKYFNSAITAYELLKEYNGDSRLDDEVERKEHYFYTGASGYYGKMGMEAVPVLEKLASEGTDKGLVYEALYSIYSETDKAKGLTYLEKGRAAFPDDTGLLFAEINHYLSEGKLDVLTDKLKNAIEKEPENVSLYVTMGNVSDQLTQATRKEGDAEGTAKYFAEAEKYYGLAIEKDPSNFDAIYSQGALYYNKAASYTESLNELANDFSAAGTKKYDALKSEMDGYFDKALPFFEKAVGINDNDLNTLIALKEIYARKNMLDKASELKTKIDAISTQG